MAKQVLTDDLLSEAEMRLESGFLALDGLTRLLAAASDQTTISADALFALIQPAVGDLREAFNCLHDRALPVA